MADSKVQLMTIPEAAKALSIAEKTMWAWVHSRRVRSTLIGRCRRIPAEAIRQLVESGMTPAVQ
jgi:excisionase family DNA binding protein